MTIDQAKRAACEKGFMQRVRKGEMSEEDKDAVGKIQWALTHGYSICSLSGKNRTLFVDTVDWERVGRIVIEHGPWCKTFYENRTTNEKECSIRKAREELLGMIGTETSSEKLEALESVLGMLDGICAKEA